MAHLHKPQSLAPQPLSSRARSIRQFTRILALFAAILLSACAAPHRPILTSEQLQERTIAQTHGEEAILESVVSKMMKRAEERGGSEATLNILAMSGGGDYGAFGAGFLVGWGDVTDPHERRPDFDCVTGVSTGAMLAPFAFLGTDESCKQVETFYRNPKKDWVKERGLLFFWPSNPSFATLPGLTRDIRATIDTNMVERIAEESRKGKSLLISSTDIDLCDQQFWDVAEIAEASADEEGAHRVQEIMLASAAIPVVFPSVQIDGAAYVDGGVTANVFVRLDPRHPGSLIQQWLREHPNSGLPKVRYWVIVNLQRKQPPHTVQMRWPDLVSPSLATSIQSSTIAEVRWLAAQADYVNVKYGAEIEVNVVSIPDDWRPPEKGTFNEATMRSLADLGRKMGADPDSWEHWTLPQE